MDEFLVHSKPLSRALFSFVCVFFHGFIFQFHSTPPCSYLKEAIKDICACCIYITHSGPRSHFQLILQLWFLPRDLSKHTAVFTSVLGPVLSLFFLPFLSIPLLLCQQYKAGSWLLLLWLKTTFLTQRLQSSAWSCPIHSNLCKSILVYVYAQDFSSVLQYCCRV